MKLKKYLENSQYINWQNPAIQTQANYLAKDKVDKNEIAKSCFEFVRDCIHHSGDFKLNPVTCKASDVLAHRTGYCYAKAHLLAALLRANNIPAGLCYQRLTISGNRPPYSLHGLNAIYLENTGWYRVDARGNKAGVNAEFCPPVECLAFPIAVAGEQDFPEIWSEPHPEVINVLTHCQTYQEVYNCLPDSELISM